MKTERPAFPLPFWAVLLIAFTCWPSILFAAQTIQLSEQECRLLAIWSRDVVWARDMGSNKENVRRWVEENEKGNEYFTVLLWKFEELWTSTESRQTIAERTWGECVGKRGTYEEPV